MNANIVHVLVRKGWAILIACLLIGEFFFFMPPGSAKSVLQVGSADLTVTQTADPASITVGDPVSFTIQIDSVGNATAYDVTLTDTLPTDFTTDWLVGGPDGAACTIANHVLSCTFAELAVGTVKTITISSPTTYSWNTCRYYAPSITNTASVIGSNEGGDAPNSATASILVLCPRVYTFISSENMTVMAGDPISYTIEIGNNSQATARDIEAEYVMPNNPGISWTFTNSNPADAASHCTFGTSGTYLTLVCNFDQLAGQETVLLTLTSPTTDESCGGVYSSGSVISSNGGGNRAKPQTINILCPLSINNFPDNGPFSAGDQIGFTIGVANTYSVPAENVVLQDALPTNSGLEWQFPPNLAGKCSIASGLLTCNLGTLAAHTDISFRIFSATSSATCGTVVNNASFTSSSRGSGSTSANVTVLCPSIFTLQWTDNMRVAGGDPVNLTVEVGNTGEGTARDLAVEYSLQGIPSLNWSIASLTQPDGTTGSCTIDTSGAYPKLECGFDQLTVNQEVNIALTSPTSYGSCGTLKSSGVLTTSNGGEYRPQDMTIKVICPPLPITNTADAGPFSAGDQIGFTIQVSNPYLVAANDVTVSDVLPANAALEWSIDDQISPECSIVNGVLTCNVGTLATNASRSFHIFSLTSSATCGTVENKASVSDSHNVVGNASASLTVNCPDLTITNIAASDAVSSGDSIRFDMTVTNDGAGEARYVTLSDTLPFFSGAQWSVDGTNGTSCTITNGILTCNFGDLAVDETRSIYITSPTIYNTCSNYSFTATITNTAAVTAYNEPAGQSNNGAIANTNVQCPSFRISVGTDTFNIVAGDPINFTVDFYNKGDGIARDVFVGVTLPTNPGLSWSIRDSNPDGAANNCTFVADESGNFELICNFDQLVPGQEVMIRLTSPTTYASCGWLHSYGYVSASNGGGVKAKRLDITVNCPNVTVTSTVDQAGFTRDYAWAVEKTVDTNYANTVLKPVPFNYTVNVSQTGFTDSAWLVQGKITVTNPNPNLAITGVTVTDAVDNGGICTVEAGTNVTIPAGGSVTLDYGCTYAAPPEYSGNNTVTVAWDQNTYPFPPPSSDVTPFEFTALSTTNQSIDVTDSLNGEVIRLNTSSILASDNPETLTTWSKTYTREAPAPTNACADYTFTTEMPGTGQSASQTVRVCLPSLVTDSALCEFDMDSATPAKDFRLLFTPDPSGPNSIYKLNASNPGQFYYNIFYANSTNAPVSPIVTLTLPYPFITQGAVPLHAYDNVRVSNQDGRACLSPGTEITNSKAAVLGMADWGSSATYDNTQEIQIQLSEIPANGFAYLNLHLDYGLKDTSGYTRGLNDNAVSTGITIPNPQSYTFTDNLGMTHSVNSINVFKKNPGIGGQAASGSTMNPVSNARMDIYDSNMKLLATVYTDEDGWYMWSYKYTGKATTFYIKATAPGYNKTQAVILKSNSFVVVNFLDMP